MPQGVGFLGRTQQYTVAVGRKELRFSLPGQRGGESVALSFEGSNAAAPSGITEAPYRTNSYLGGDVSKYRSGIRNYSRIGLNHVYPGIDAEFYASGDEIEHDFIVAPGADASAISMRLSSATAAKLTAQGEVLVPATAGELRLKKPVAYQAGADGRQTEVAAAFVLEPMPGGGQGVHFRLGAYDHSRKLVIDPVILYASYLAGTAGSTADAIATEPTNGIFVAGTTVSSSFDPSPADNPATAVTPVVNCTTTPCGNNAFIANFTNGSSGPTLRWVTYIGAADASHQLAVTSMVVNSSRVFLGGYTNEASLAASAGAVAANPAPSLGLRMGYISSLAPDTGVLNETALVYDDITQANDDSVMALTFDPSGNLYAAGSLGSATGATVHALTPTSDAFGVTPAGTNAISGTPPPQPGNAYVLGMPAGQPISDSTTHLVKPVLFTYVQNTAMLNGIAVDGGASVYLAGQALSFTLPGVSATADANAHAFELTFKDIAPSQGATPVATVTQFSWIAGNGTDKGNGISIDGAGNSYLFGNTTSSNLAALATTASLIQTAVPDTAGSGFVAVIPAAPATLMSSGTPPQTLTYLGGSGTHDSVTSGLYVKNATGNNGTLYITGQTDAPAATDSTAHTIAFAGVASTAFSSAAPFNKQAMVQGMDATTPGAPHGYLVSLRSDLTAVHYVANVGGPGGTDIANGVALDSAQNAWIAADIGLGSSAVPAPAYTSYSAYEITSPAAIPATTSAYVAEIASTGRSAQLTLSAASGSPSATTIGFVDAVSTPINFTWTLQSGASNPVNDLVLQIPAVTGLTFTAPKITDQTAAGTPVSSSCAFTPSVGVSCVISSLPQTNAGTNDALSIELDTTTNKDLVQSATASTLNVTANVFGPASDYASMPQSATVQSPALLTITPSTFPANSANAGNTSSDPGALVTYTVSVKNDAAAGDSAQTSFVINDLPNGFVAIGATGTVGGKTVCTTVNVLSPCSPFDLQPGATFTYVVTGVYPDSNIPANTASVTLTSPMNVTTAGYLASVPASIATNTTVNRSSHLKITGTLASGSSALNLDAEETYKLQVSNTGASAASGTFNVILPANFTADAAPEGGCSYTAATNTYSGCPINSLAAGANTWFQVSGKFIDNSANASIAQSAVARTFNATVALTDATDSSPTPADETTSSTVNVQRTANLSLPTEALTLPATSCQGSGARCVYMKNVADTQDSVPYSFVVNNAGPNIALNTAITITLPNLPGHIVSSVNPSVSLTPTGGGNSAVFSPLSACTYSSATNQITCTAGNIAVGTATIAGTITFDDTAVPAAAAFVNTAAGTVHVAASAMGAAPADNALAAFPVVRAAHLVTTKSVAATGTAHAIPINLDENAPSTAPGVNDTFTVTVQIANTPLNDAPGVTVTEMLPAYFRMIAPPPVAANCTIGGSPIAANYTTSGTSVAMSCNVGTVLAGSAAPGNSTAPQSFTYSGKFVDNGTATDITGSLPNKAKQLTAPLGTATSVTTLAADPINTSDATSANQSIPVERLVHLLLRKTRNATVAKAPSSFSDTLDPNLDEKTNGTTFGVNDEVEYDIAVGNAGVNKAIGVQFTETLPPYFTLEKAYLVSGASTTPDTGANAVPSGQLPASSIACYAGSALGATPITLPLATGAGGMQITCSYGTSAAPLALAAGSSLASTTPGSTPVEFVYQGKYQDNAPGVDDLGAGVSTYQVISVAGEAAASTLQAVDNGPATDSRNQPVSPYQIQRAAHLAIVSTAAQLRPTMPNDLPLTLDSTGNPLVAEAEPSINGGTPVYNCLRYKVMIQNIGPNVARQPQLTVTAPAGLNLTESPSGVTTTPGSDAPLPSSCSYGGTTAPTINGSAIAPVSQLAGNTLVVDVDGYFGLNTLNSNSQSGFALSFTSLGDTGIKDSSPGSFKAMTSSAVTVVNTPSGANFQVSPFSTTGTRPAKISFGIVNTPGVTSTAVSTAGPALPNGASPDPRDNKKVIPLYRTGAAPAFYSLATTAIPAVGTNPTGICLTNGGATGPLADGFAKPERVLLWALAGLPIGSTVNPVPNVAAPYLGDITSSVMPSNGSSYVAPGGPGMPYTDYADLPGPQSQPAQVCGQVNGFAPSATPMTVAVLEPVNFSPYISPNNATLSQTPGKGVSEVSFLFPNVTHDYNDNDPCYVAASTSGTSARGACNDNLFLTTWIFGGESLVPSQNHVIGPLSPSAAQAFTATPYEVQSGATLFLQVADQLAAPLYNAKQDCDPGNAAGSYNPNTVNACPINKSLLAGTPPQETVFGSAEIALLTPSVDGGSSGLIALPPAADATVPTTPVASGYVAATASITAGQTVGFEWKLGDVIPAAGGTYNLSCFMVDAATQSTVTAFPAGLSCQIPPSILYPPNATPATAPTNPAIYIVTIGNQSAKNAAPAWKTAAEGVVAAMVLPLLLFRRRGQSRKLGLLVILLLLGGAVSLSGCGSGSGAAGAPGTSAVAANTYFFRASATPVNGGATLTTAPFQVKVVAGD